MSFKSTVSAILFHAIILLLNKWSAGEKVRHGRYESFFISLTGLQKVAFGTRVKVLRTEYKRAKVGALVRTRSVSPSLYGRGRLNKLAANLNYVVAAL